MLKHAAARAAAVRDDQQILVRYAHARPHLVAVDVARRLMFTYVYFSYALYHAIYYVLLCPPSVCLTTAHP